MVEISKLLKPKIDYVFKRIFGYVGNEQITANLLSSILDEQIIDVNLDCNTFLQQDIFDDKLGILDVRAKTDTGIDIDVEMQVVEQKSIVKRLLYYWSKMYAKQIKSGEDYNTLNKCVVILIADFELDELVDAKKYITKWVIKEKYYGKMMLTDLFELCILELPKVSKYYEKNELDTWVKFIENPEVINMSEEKNDAVKKAKKVLEDISNDEKERYIAELREKYILDQNSFISTGYDKGLKAGIEQGIQRGIEQGIQKNNIEIAKKMIEKNIDFEIISELTGISVEELKKI